MRSSTLNIITYLLCFVGFLFSQEWEILGSGVTVNLYDVDFVDSETGWAVGLNGTIVRTGNSGEKWERQESSVEEFLAAVDFIDKDNGWVVGKDYILNTKNGGKTWQIQYQQDLEDGYFRDVQFLDEKTGWVVGGRGFLGGKGVMLKTTTGGEHWEARENNWPTLAAISFIDKQYGWICGAGGKILSTNDGGETWQEQNLEVSPRPFLRSLQFVDRYYGWTASRDDWLGFYRTTDGGKAWIQRSGESLGIFGVQAFFFVDSLNGWLSTFPGAGYEIAKTTDGGQTWEFQEPLGILRIHSFYFLNKELGWAVGWNGAILRYTYDALTVPSTFHIGNFPNPFNKGTTIFFTLSRQQEVTVSIYNVLGQKLDTPYDETADKGSQVFWWSAKGLPTGNYFVRIQCEEGTRTIQCTLSK